MRPTRVLENEYIDGILRRCVSKPSCDSRGILDSVGRNAARCVAHASINDEVHLSRYYSWAGQRDEAVARTGVLSRASVIIG